MAPPRCLNLLQRLSVFSVCAALCFAQTPRSQEPIGAGQRIPVLLVSGSDAFHDWRATTPVTRSILEQTGRFDVRVIEDVQFLDSRASLARYRLIFFNQQVFDSTPALRENLTAYLRSGGGLVALHWAVDNFHDWPEFADVLGRVWQEGISKEEHGRFHVHIVDAEHPVTRGMPDFDTLDEEAVHYRLRGSAPIHVLATARTEAGEDVPVMFVRQFGKGRVFFSPFGHTAHGRQNPAIHKMIVRASEWAATGAVR